MLRLIRNFLSPLLRSLGKPRPSISLQSTEPLISRIFPVRDLAPMPAFVITVPYLNVKLLNFLLPALCNICVRNIINRKAQSYLKSRCLKLLQWCFYSQAWTIYQRTSRCRWECSEESLCGMSPLQSLSNHSFFFFFLCNYLFFFV